MGRLQKTGFCSRWLPYRNGPGSCGMQVREDRDESPFSCPVTVWGDSIVPGHPVGGAVAESWLDHWGAAGGWLIRSRAVSVTASAVLVGQDECPARAGPSPLQASHQEDTGHGQRTLALGHSGRRCSSAWHGGRAAGGQWPHRGHCQPAGKDGAGTGRGIRHPARACHAGRPGERSGSGRDLHCQPARFTSPLDEGCRCGWQTRAVRKGHHPQQPAAGGGVRAGPAEERAGAGGHDHPSHAAVPQAADADRQRGAGAGEAGAW